MDKEKFRCIILALNHSQLTPVERNFVQRVKENYENNNMLTEQQESILEGIHREKIRWISHHRKEADTAKSPG